MASVNLDRQGWKYYVRGQRVDLKRRYSVAMLSADLRPFFGGGGSTKQPTQPFAFYSVQVDGKTWYGVAGHIGSFDENSPSVLFDSLPGVEAYTRTLLAKHEQTFSPRYNALRVAEFLERQEAAKAAPSMAGAVAGLPDVDGRALVGVGIVAAGLGLLLFLGARK